MMKGKITRIVLLVLSLLVILWFLLPGYLRKALVYQKAGIDDYRLFSNRLVKAGTPVPWKTHKDYNSSRLPDSLLAAMEEYETTAFLVVVDDSILFESYWDGYSDSSYSNSFSAAKSIVSLLTGALVDEGKIQSLDHPVTHYLPEFKDTEYDKITVRHLLTMSSGLDWDESYASAFSPTTKAYYGKELKDVVSGLKLKDQPGTIFNYKSCDTQLLSMILEAASGKSLSEVASEKLWKPLGAERDALWSLDNENGHEKAYCCFNSNARDFARIGQMVLDSGAFAGKQVISKAYIREATKAASSLKDANGDPCSWYGFQFWLTRWNHHAVVYARGILGQYILVVPDKRMVIVRLGKKRSDTYKEKTPLDVFTYIGAGFSVLSSSERVGNSGSKE